MRFKIIVLCLIGSLGYLTVFFMSIYFTCYIKLIKRFEFLIITWRIFIFLRQRDGLILNLLLLHYKD